MLELHYGDPTADALKLLIALGENHLTAAITRVDTAGFGQYSDAHRRLAPHGQLPVLVDGGLVMTESGLALQYLAEAYPPHLAPTDPLGWYRVQVWNKTIDASVAPGIALIGWTSVTTAAARDAYRRVLASVPDREQPAGWTAVVADAEASEDQLALARDRVGETLDRMERVLADSDWLVGDRYSIADINTFAQLHTLPRLMPGRLSKPVADWLRRVGERPAVRAALAEAANDTGTDAYAAPG